MSDLTRIADALERIANALEPRTVTIEPASVEFDPELIDCETGENRALIRFRQLVQKAEDEGRLW